MTLLPILRWPDPVLARVCAPVTDLAAARALAADMLETMYAAPGRGLAAPQVGVPLRQFVMDLGWKDGAPDPVVMLNPRLLSASDDLSEVEEGCLSIPGILAPVTRPVAVRMAWTALDGAAREADLTGMAARCAQHELDHLDGRVIFDRLSEDRRADLLARFLAA